MKVHIKSTKDVWNITFYADYMCIGYYVEFIYML